MPRQSKKAKAAEPAPEPVPQDPDDDDEEEEEEDSDEPKRREEQEEEEEEEADAGADEATRATRLKNLKRSRINERRKARQNGYRAYAETAGAGAGKGSFGNDLMMGIFSQSDIKRMATWCPVTGDVHMPLSQFETHLALRDESLSTGPLRVLAANVESFARKVATELVLRNVESSGPMTISAANVKSVLRPFVGALHSSEFTAPGGVVRIAQQTSDGYYKLNDDGKRVFFQGDGFLLPKNEEEDAAIAEERKFAKANQVKLLKDKDKKRDAMIAERKKKRAEKPAAGTATPLATVAA
jgi:hypothetical protein